MRLGAWLGAGVGAAGLLAAVIGCGSGGAQPVAGGSRSSSPSAPGSVSGPGSVPGSVPGAPSPAGTAPAAIPAATLRALTSGHAVSITAVAAPGSALPHPAQSQAMALRTALAQEPPGSQVLGLTLARVKGFGFGSDMSSPQLVWLVSVDPFGGSYPAGNPACGRLSYVVEFIDPGTGRWLLTSSGQQSGLAPLPQLGPTPTLAQPSPSCGIPAPHAHLGTPAAN